METDTMSTEQDILRKRQNSECTNSRQKRRRLHRRYTITLGNTGLLEIQQKCVLGRGDRLLSSNVNNRKIRYGVRGIH